MPTLDDVVGDLRGVLADLQDIDLWPPWDAVHTVVRAVGKAVEIAAEAPEPAPDHCSAAADGWMRIAWACDGSTSALSQLASGISPGVWEGGTGNAVRRSVGNLLDRTTTVDEAARGVARALWQLEDRMTAARARWRSADDRLRDNLSISWSDLWPWEAVDYLRGVVGGIVEAVEESIGAYQDASGAVRVAQREITEAMDGVAWPDHLPEGLPSVTGLVNAWDDEGGPIDGSVLDRFDGALAGLSPAERQRVTDALAATADPDARAWIMAGVASGLTGKALERYIARLQRMSPSELAALDPGRYRAGPDDDPRDPSATQPDQTTCGSSSLVMSRMENDPAYAMWVLTGYDPATGETDSRGPEERFNDESERMHTRTNLPLDRDQQLQFPWPPQLGTQPWAVAAEMSADGGSGVPGTSYGVDLVDPDDRGETFDRMVRASEAGHTVPIYVGDQTRPGHVALVTAAGDGSVSVYEPASGTTVTVSREDWVSGNVDVAGWDEPWAVVVPD